MTTARLTRRFVVLRGLRWLPLGVIVPYAVLVMEARGLTLAAIGALWAVHSAVVLALELPSGALADTVGRRRALLAGGVLTTASLVVFAFAESPGAFAAALATLAAGRALTSGALEAWFVDSLRALDPAAALRGGLAGATAADAAGMFAGAVAGGVLPLVFGSLPHSGGGVIVYTPASLFAAAAAAVYVLAVARLVSEPRRAKGQPRARPRAILEEAAATVRGSSLVRTLLVTASAMGVTLSAVEILWQPRLSDLLGTADGHSLLFGAFVAGSMVVTAGGAALSPRLAVAIGVRRAYPAGLALGAVGLVALAAAGGPVALAAAFGLFYLALGAIDPLHIELLNEATGPTARATVLSAESLAGQGGAVVGNAAIAAMAATAGIPAAWLLAGSVLGAAALVALRLVGAPQRTVTPSPVGVP